MPPPEGFLWGLSARSVVCGLGSQGHFQGAGAWSLRSPSRGRAWDVRGICGRGPSHNGGLASRKGGTETLQWGVRPGEWGSHQESPASGLRGPAGRGVASVREGLGVFQVTGVREGLRCPRGWGEENGRGPWSGSGSAAGPAPKVQTVHRPGGPMGAETLWRSPQFPGPRPHLGPWPGHPGSGTVLGV